MEPTKEEIERYLELDSKRKALSREIATLEKELKPLGESFRAWLEAKGKNAVKRLGYMFALVTGRTYPKWKEAFVQHCGQIAASEVESTTPPSMSLTITPINVES